MLLGCAGKGKAAAGGKGGAKGKGGEEGNGSGRKRKRNFKPINFWAASKGDAEQVRPQLFLPSLCLLLHLQALSSVSAGMQLAHALSKPLPPACQVKV